MVTFSDPTNKERPINIELAAQPEYKRLRSMAKQTAKFNLPPFTVIKDNRGRCCPAGGSCWPT